MRVVFATDTSSLPLFFSLIPSAFVLLTFFSLHLLFCYIRRCTLTAPTSHTNARLTGSLAKRFGVSIWILIQDHLWKREVNKKMISHILMHILTREHTRAHIRTLAHSHLFEDRLAARFLLLQVPRLKRKQKPLVNSLKRSG